MGSDVIVALLGLVGTLAGSFLGVVASGKLTNYRLKALEDRVAKHNSLVERTYILEGTVRSVCQEIRELKGFHKPGAAK